MNEYYSTLKLEGFYFKIMILYTLYSYIFFKNSITPRLCTWRAIAEAKQRCQWSVMGWVIKTLSSRAPRCFGRHIKPLVPAAFAFGDTHQYALGLRGGLWP
jgi:hypothetical protein